MDENACRCNISMEREQKTVPRRVPIVWGNMTGAEGVTGRVQGEMHLQESDCCQLPMRDGPLGTPLSRSGAHPSQNLGTSSLGTKLSELVINLISCS